MRALVLLFLLSCAVSLIANWAVREFARFIGLVDRPDGHRKLQSRAVPLAGGIAIFLAATGIIVWLITVAPFWRTILLAYGSQALGLLIAGALIVALGVLDDFVGLRGRQKLVGQI